MRSGPDSVRLGIRRMRLFCFRYLCYVLSFESRSGLWIEDEQQIEASARLRDSVLCQYFLSLASTGFLEHLKMPTDGALSTKCLPSPCQEMLG